MTIDQYIKSRWPADVPEDCTRLNGRELDCLERGAVAWCPSCKTYDELHLRARRYAARSRVTPSPVSSALAARRS